MNDKEPEFINKKQPSEPKNDLYEAPASVTYDLMSPSGYPCLYTVRADHGATLMTKMKVIEEELVKGGYKPHERYSKNNHTNGSTKETKDCPAHPGQMLEKAWSKAKNKPYWIHRNTEGKACFGSGFQD